MSTIVNENLHKAERILRVVNNQFVARILEVLRNKGESNVTGIYVSLRLDQAVVSQHLARMRWAGIVSRKKNGKEIIYSVNDERLNQIMELCNDLVKDPEYV